MLFAQINNTHRERERSPPLLLHSHLNVFAEQVRKRGLWIYTRGSDGDVIIAYYIVSFSLIADDPGSSSTQRASARARQRTLVKQYTLVRLVHIYTGVLRVYAPHVWPAVMNKWTLIARVYICVCAPCASNHIYSMYVANLDHGARRCDVRRPFFSELSVALFDRSLRRCMLFKNPCPWPILRRSFCPARSPLCVLSIYSALARRRWPKRNGRMLFFISSFGCVLLLIFLGVASRSRAVWSLVVAPDNVVRSTLW